MNITNYIINNFKDESIEELKSSIEDATSTDDEVVLPGLGVMFKILWNNYNNKDEILTILKNNMKTS